MKGTGRPLKLTPEVQERICRFIRDGNFPATAARASGIDYSTFRRWMDAGKHDAVEFSGKLMTRSQRAFFQAFRAAIEDACAMCETLLVGAIRKAAFEVSKDPVSGLPIVNVKDWRAAEMLLRARYVERWREDIDGADEERRPQERQKPVVVFGARYAPSGELIVPALPPAPGVQTSAPEGVKDGEIADPGDPAPHDLADAAAGRVQQPAAKPQSEMPDV